MNEELQKAINLAIELGYSHSPSGRRHFFEIGNVIKLGNRVQARITFIENSKLELVAGKTVINYQDNTIGGLITFLNLFSNTEICLN